jgi:NAD(P)-dependent dehydrogenase (short-subunit alcohol dehydrogenase family)
MRLKDKVALVTGAVQGLGAAIARRFGREGAQVFLGDLKEAEGDAFAAQLKKDNIRANLLCPSTVETPLVQEMLKNPERRQERLGEVPLGRLASLDDVAGAALYLASDEAAFINGVAFPVDGGLTAG